ncbi:hypothetical protein [Methanolacinia petrolearia]|nr:hypothetical protein [Methanolacinia petrolearia]
MADDKKGKKSENGKKTPIKIKPLSKNGTEKRCLSAHTPEGKKPK